MPLCLNGTGSGQTTAPAHRGGAREPGKSGRSAWRPGFPPRRRPIGTFAAPACGGVAGGCSTGGWRAGRPAASPLHEGTGSVAPCGGPTRDPLALRTPAPLPPCLATSCRGPSRGRPPTGLTLPSAPRLGSWTSPHGVLDWSGAPPAASDDTSPHERQAQHLDARTGRERGAAHCDAATLPRGGRCGRLRRCTRRGELRGCPRRRRIRTCGLVLPRRRTS